MDVGSFLILFAWLSQPVTSYSMEKHLIDAATKPEMFDMFHVMPDGMMKLVQELDMLLSIDQYRELYMEDHDHDHHSTEKRATRHKRKALRSISKRWPNYTVFYEITESFDTEDRAKIKEAIDEWEKYTCLTFVESETEQRRIQFKDGSMCLSSLGMRDEPQTLMLGSGCRTKGIIIHEIGHAVGWFHEHMRPDRDRYLNVQFSVIPPKFRPNYKKYNSRVIDTYGIPYDYTSIMHYGDSAFPGSLVARDPRFQLQLGQRNGFSFKDIKLANVMYGCAEISNCSEKNCGDGFPFFKEFKGESSCECWCDSGNIDDPLTLCSEQKTTVPPPKSTLPPPTSAPPMECMDVLQKQTCKELKDDGKCKKKMALMMANCAKTCGFCGKGEGMCMDYDAGCGVMEGRCEDPGLRSTMSQICMATCDKCSSPPDPCEIHNIMLGDEGGSKSEGVSTLPRNVVVNVLISACVVIFYFL